MLCERYGALMTAVLWKCTRAILFRLKIISLFRKWICTYGKKSKRQREPEIAEWLCSCKFPAEIQIGTTEITWWKSKNGTAKYKSKFFFSCVCSFHVFGTLWQFGGFFFLPALYLLCAMMNRFHCVNRTKQKAVARKKCVDFKFVDMIQFICRQFHMQILKKKRKKKTHRHRVESLEIESTECVEWSMCVCAKSIKNTMIHGESLYMCFSDQPLSPNIESSASINRFWFSLSDFSFYSGFLLLLLSAISVCMV